jgi:hypothetical protein
LITHSSPTSFAVVAGVRRRAVHGFRRQRILREFDRDIGIVQILQALAGLCVGQEEIPQAFLLRFRLGLPEHVELRVAKAPTVLLAFAMAIKFDRHRVDGFPDEFLDVLEQRPDLIRHAQIVEFFARIEIVGRRAGHIGVFHGFSPIGAGRFVWHALCSLPGNVDACAGFVQADAGLHFPPRGMRERS